MIRPQLTADGLAVRIPIADRVAPVLDELAVAFADDPDTVAALLRAHAARVVRLDLATTDADATDYGRAVAAAEADGTREALTEQLPSADRLDDVLTPTEAFEAVDRLAAIAARAHFRNDRSNRR